MQSIEGRDTDVVVTPSGEQTDRPLLYGNTRVFFRDRFVSGDLVCA